MVRCSPVVIRFGVLGGPVCGRGQSSDHGRHQARDYGADVVRFCCSRELRFPEFGQTQNTFNTEHSERNTLYRATATRGGVNFCAWRATLSHGTVKSTSPLQKNGYENCIYSTNNINMSDEDNNHDTNHDTRKLHM